MKCFVLDSLFGLFGIDESGSIVNFRDFDNDPQKIGQSVGKFIVKDTQQMVEEIQAKKIRVAMLAVPASEAQGIADSQAIIDKSLTSEYLRWYWISHLQDYDSVIYVPIGADGMPMFKTIN